MKCPACKSELSPYSHGGETIDVCRDCDGIWFDSAELSAVAQSLLKEGNVRDQEVGDALGAKVKTAGEHEEEKQCPRCGVSTQIFNYAYSSNVFLNRCPSCSGVWADSGELEGVAEFLKGSPAVNRYAEELGKKVIKDHSENRVIRLLKWRPLSGTVALLYLLLAVFFDQLEGVLRMGLSLLLPLSCIWFSDLLGNYAGKFMGFRPAITEKTPPSFILVAGWFILLLPVIMAIYGAIQLS